MLPISTPDRLPDVARDCRAAGSVLTAISGRDTRAVEGDARALNTGGGRDPDRFITNSAPATCGQATAFAPARNNGQSALVVQI
ncbi:hypothetical protein [Roseobacter ponti]|uniref:Uncharacterized protein n=1 Tax=Roseobacter ponti TaxID=1891787 RepID=A0A858SV32_9RHOB|nr:hypothetical protein [Roseobacter ponti]QJF51692.1 hypothetical protein G3256_11220 [Roseobacter ponti]